MKRIAIDMDEVIADALGRHIELYNADYNGSVTREQLHGKSLWQIVPEQHRSDLDSYFESENFFRTLPVMPNSQEVVRDLCSRYEVFITTAAMDVPCSFMQKFEWLGEHFPFIPSSHIVFCGDKSIIAADYLIDDAARHFRRFRGQGILFSAPHNRTLTGYKRVETGSKSGRCSLVGILCTNDLASRLHLELPILSLLVFSGGFERGLKRCKRQHQRQ